MKYKRLLLVLYLVLLVAITGDYVIHRPSPPGAPKGIIRFTQAYDSFTDWNWFIDPKTWLSMGVNNDPDQTQYGPKIHPINPADPQPWSGGEYFCDPDTVIVASTKSKYNIAYGDSLNWHKGSYLSQDRQMARLSFKYEPADGIREKYAGITSDVNHMQLDIREDDTIESGKPWVETLVTITNRYSEPADILYIYQDAAYMWLPDQNQNKDTPVFMNLKDSSVSTDSFQFVPNGDKGYVIGTYNSQHNIFGGLYTDDPYAMVGNLPDYMLMTKQYSDGRAQVDAKQYTIDGFFQNTLDMAKSGKGYAKVRAMAFPLRNIQPGQTVTLHFWRIGLRDASQSPLSAEAWKQKVINILPK